MSIKVLRDRGGARAADLAEQVNRKVIDPGREGRSTVQQPPTGGWLGKASNGSAWASDTLATVKNLLKSMSATLDSNLFPPAAAKSVEAAKKELALAHQQAAGQLEVAQQAIQKAEKAFDECLTTLRAAPGDKRCAEAAAEVDRKLDELHQVKVKLGFPVLKK